MVGGQNNTEPGTGKKALAVFLCLVGGLMLALLTIILASRFAISKGSLKTLFRSEAVESDIYEAARDGVAGSLKAAGINVDSEAIKGTDDMFAGVMHDMIMFVLSGEGDPVKVDRVSSWIKDNREYLEEVSGQTVRDEDIKEIEQEIGRLNESAKKDFRLQAEDNVLVKIFFGKTSLIIILLLTIVILGAVFFIFKGRIDKSLVYVGVTSVVYSSMAAAIALMLKFIAGAEGAGDMTFGMLMGLVAKKYLITSLAFLFAGIASVIAGKRVSVGR